MSQMGKVNSTYGTPMGRHSRGNPDNCAPRSVRLFRVHLDNGGYDDGGAYWGYGAPIYCATDGADYFQTVRAGSRARAAIELGLYDYLDRMAQSPRRAMAAYAFDTLNGRAPKWEGWTNADACAILTACGVAMGRPEEGAPCH